MEFINRQKRAVTPKKAYHAMGNIEKKEFQKAVDELKEEAVLIKNNKGKLMSPFLCGFVPSKVITASKGFLFVKPMFSESEGDIYVPVEKSSGALVDDVVIISKIKNTHKGLSGSVEKIVKKGDRISIGLIKTERKHVYFVADEGYRYEIPVLRNFNNGARNNDKVQVKLTVQKNKIFAKVLKIYGKACCASVCADAAMDKNNIAINFSKKALAKADELAAMKIKKKDLKNRLDLRDEPVFTIDGEDAKDLDDAISIKKLKDGYELGVHIADVSHYVKLNGHLDLEARERGTSVYFADRVIPMLPKQISNGVCSLNQGEDKLTFSVIMKLSENGDLLSYDFKKSVINSKVRGVYSEINKILDGSASKEILQKYKDILGCLEISKTLSDLLEIKANERGKLNLDSAESKFTLNEYGACIDVQERQRGASERIIENFMILANVSAAHFARKNDIPFVYRVHEEPDPERVIKLSQFVTLFDFKLPKSAINNPEPQHFLNLLNQAKNSKFYNLFSNQVLRTMSKARYFDKPLGHFGLSLRDYSHFTSPIRRYSDTTIHRILSDLISGKDLYEIRDKYKDLAAEVSKSVSVSEINAVNAEREAEKYYMAEYMQAHIGENFEGQVSGVIQKGIFVKLKNTIEGFVNLEYSPKDKFIFDGLVSLRSTKTGKKLTIGDTVKISVDSVNIAEGEINFLLVR